MGEVSDDMVDGTMCSLCGTCFVGAHGFPVLCASCWNEASAVDRQNYQKATLKEL